jgi:hypothetical protein
MDMWPLLTGGETPIERPPLLYFNAWDLQCARWKNWKLHVARHNAAAYSPGPPGGVHNFHLTRPELYDLDNDPDESYDVAAERPEMVAQIQEHIAKMMPGFPEPVQKAYADSKARPSSETMPAGAWPR